MSKLWAWIGVVGTCFMGATLAAGCDSPPLAKPSITVGASAGTATRGGSDNEKAPGTSQKSANPTTMGNVVAPKASIAPPADGDRCGGMTDGTAWCDSDTSLGFCSGGFSYSVDCSAFATSDNQYSFDAGGYCYELGSELDCLLCFTGASGAVTCCDAGLSICCDTTGACFLPASSG